MKDDLIGLLRPFRGSDVRRLCGVFTLAVALPRLPLWDIMPPVSILGLLPPSVYGWLFLALGIALLATNGRWRTRMIGRLLAFIALVLWGVLLGGTTSITSMIINLAVMWAMVGEIMAGDYEC